MFGFSNEFQILDAIDSIVLQCAFIFCVFMTIYEHQFMFVQLHFHWLTWIQYGDAAATIVQQQVFVVIETIDGGPARPRRYRDL